MTSVTQTRQQLRKIILENTTWIKLDGEISASDRVTLNKNNDSINDYVMVDSCDADDDNILYSLSRHVDGTHSATTLITDICNEFNLGYMSRFPNSVHPLYVVKNRYTLASMTGKISRQLSQLIVDGITKPGLTEDNQIPIISSPTVDESSHAWSVTIYVPLTPQPLLDEYYGLIWSGSRLVSEDRQRKIAPHNPSNRRRIRMTLQDAVKEFNATSNVDDFDEGIDSPLSEWNFH